MAWSKTLVFPAPALDYILVAWAWPLLKSFLPASCSRETVLPMGHSPVTSQQSYQGHSHL